MDLSAEFPLDPAIAYLNHAAVSPWPARTAQAVIDFANDNLHRGSQHYPHWLQVEQRLRERLARLINAASPSDIALLKNTSEALSVVAYGIDWQPGDQVVITDQEFPSNRIVWESLQQYGVQVVAAPLSSETEPEDAVLAAITPQTRLVSVSAVQYGTGLRLDLSRIGQVCNERDILFCVDAIQAIGATALDVAETCADFVMADGHKWMLGPEGLALFWVRPQRRDDLQLRQYGWHMVEHPGEFDRTQWVPSHDARRFECGSPNMLAIHALDASVGLLLDYTSSRIEEDITSNINYLIEQIDKLSNFELITSRDPSRRAGILTVRPLAESPDVLYRRLMDQGVMCAARGGGVRFSPHFYTPARVLDLALDQLA